MKSLSILLLFALLFASCNRKVESPTPQALSQAQIVEFLSLDAHFQNAAQLLREHVYQVRDAEQERPALPVAISENLSLAISALMDQEVNQELLRASAVEATIPSSLQASSGCGDQCGMAYMNMFYHRYFYYYDQLGQHYETAGNNADRDASFHEAECLSFCEFGMAWSDLW